MIKINGGIGNGGVQRISRGVVTIISSDIEQAVLDFKASVIVGICGIFALA